VSERRLYQCPGCWDFRYIPALDGGYECGCGERMTRIDLREAEASAAALAEREALAEIGRLSLDWLKRAANPDQSENDAYIAWLNAAEAALAETPEETRRG
jgi:hypothetical protein